MSSTHIPHEVTQAATVILQWLAQQAPVAANASTPADTWVSQRNSPLGNRRHVNAVRRLVAAGSSEARIVGRRYDLTRSALDRVAAELGRATQPSATTDAPAADELANLRRRYASLGVQS